MSELMNRPLNANNVIMLKKILQWLAIIIGLVLLALVVAGLFINESKPERTGGSDADALAHKMLKAINCRG